MGATVDQQVSLTLALAYLSYYTANSPAGCSGAPQNKIFSSSGPCTSPSSSSGTIIDCDHAIALQALACHFSPAFKITMLRWQQNGMQSAVSYKIFAE